MSNEPAQEVESWQVKMFSAEDVSELIKNARGEFMAEVAPEERGECTVCHAGKHDMGVYRVQHFMDVGGPDTLMCEWCWVGSIIDFWMQERAAERQANGKA